MIILLHNNIQEDEINLLMDFIAKSGYKPRLVTGEQNKIIELIGHGNLDIEDVRKFACVEKVHRIEKPYKRISFEGGRRRHEINVGGVTIGGKKLIIMIGPCAVESYEQTETAAKQIANFPKNDAIEGYILRGGAFKPRTSPYAFEGLGEKGLEILSDVGKKYNLPVITEVMSASDVELVNKYTDIHQVGTRNFQNFRLLDALGEVDKPVLLKRGMSGTIEEFLLAAERIAAHGNPDVILCLRGIRTFNDAYRNDVDSADVVRIKQLCNLPVIFDPSHSTGNRDAILPVSMGAIAMGIDGILVDLHPKPEEALVDGAQALWPEMGERLIAASIIVKKAQLEASKLYITAEEARNRQVNK
ncbi:MAG: 3-deoxy-7-phosphoheptulonate synthase [Spirochaetia bacterium]|nr:3-deoxy-7-phosphoheptulonate synthase [Spirochaetia bacterium]